ncbi:hypothetical protein [Streptomyces nymphaeiformis]|jgi:hypothetical protein|uniref:Uncharacterized protein n=1 Tax=Streptomyces nymphaeiformis TaxID=2663842 RepID=A0A7W7U509_9ACTN|nr:hypothetical protein [Streptomyces nymphaeiformis]MBB4985003.1 hypothetical protein [Streptomyces nymphaeiformis]
MVTADQAIAAAAEAVAIVAAKRHGADDQAQVDALLDATALIARDVREDT